MGLIATVCLALNIYYEARGEPIDGQIAVAEVTLNRVADPRWPDTVCEVVYQPRQFSWTANPYPIREPEALAQSWEIASAVISGERLGIEATHYHATSIADPWGLPLIGQIGNHRFYE